MQNAFINEALRKQYFDILNALLIPAFTPLVQVQPISMISVPDTVHAFRSHVDFINHILRNFISTNLQLQPNVLGNSEDASELLLVFNYRDRLMLQVSASARAVSVESFPLFMLYPETYAPCYTNQWAAQEAAVKKYFPSPLVEVLQRVVQGWREHYALMRSKKSSATRAWHLLDTMRVNMVADMMRDAEKAAQHRYIPCT
jgi:hypothetical protein